MRVGRPGSLLCVGVFALGGVVLCLGCSRRKAETETETEAEAVTESESESESEAEPMCRTTESETEAEAEADNPAAALGRFVDGESASRLVEHLDKTSTDLAERLHKIDDAGNEDVDRLLRAQVRANLDAKAKLTGPAGEIFPLTEEEIRRTVIDYEAFKIEAYVTSGVFPKRYFGYFDGKWDTAEHERTLAAITHTSVEVINAWLVETDQPLRINDAEVAVTWVAEGGALLLRENQAELNSVHPVYGVGLDDIASGTAELNDLMGRLDTALGTDLSGIVGYRDTDDGEQAVLKRHMTFQESIAGTALMWVWEKRIAQRKLKKDGRKLLHDRPLDEQFILGSLVYNSGLIHSEGREFEIRDFRTGDRLKSTSDRNAHRRQELNLVPPADALAELLIGKGYRDQHTSWLAVYHVLQRYGGWLGLRRHTDTFDESGTYRMERWE